MEFILVIAIIVVLCIILGVKTIYLLAAGAALLGLIYIASLALLCFFFVRLFFAKKHKAVFSRIDKNPRGSFKVAYYTIDGTEYPNVFPEEGLLRSKLYRSDRNSTVFLTKNKKNVYDKFACATCTIGFLLTIATAVAVIMILR
ncbi:MAG: hypothetical protein J6X85_10845 [Ruminococcus sp.]|nr:hypothetical protein [Ruminococcus sp.]MBP5582258.1 hypothetical protein [Ruminococcus sp.]